LERKDLISSEWGFLAAKRAPCGDQHDARRSKAGLGCFGTDLEAMAAKAEEDRQPCVEYIGPRGASHFVKMVHNGIEYGDMQLIAEVYDVDPRAWAEAKETLGYLCRMEPGWSKSYLIQITSEILAKVDPDTGKPLVEMILDEAQQKGTGKWTSQKRLDIGALSRP
jgi:6-phosphogluconate dehydrogenase